MTTKLHDTLSSALGALGGLLRCTTCGHERQLSEAQIAAYLRHGWPKHCGYTMRWITSRELDAERQEGTGA